MRPLKLKKFKVKSNKEFTACGFFAFANFPIAIRPNLQLYTFRNL